MLVSNDNEKGMIVESKKSRLEMNVRMLLCKCETMAKEQSVEDNWRLKKYVEDLNDMLSDLKSGLIKPPKEVLTDYSKRTTFLKGLIQTASMSCPMEKLEAVQMLSHGSATAYRDSSAQEIHQKTVSKYNTELRSELLGSDTDDSLRKRNIIKAPNFTSNSTSQEDIDTLLKYHQNMQEKVAENMVMLTRNLKEQSQIASTIIKRDTEALKKSSDLTERNMLSLKVESGRLQEHSKGAWKCWLWLMLAVVMVVFIYMVLFMKLVKKKTYVSA